MPDPGAVVLAACRDGTAQRHMLMHVAHPSGTVRVWDGIGDFSFGGNTYLGVGGLGMVQGLSDSADIQQHEITCTLNNVPLSAMRTDDGDVRGVEANVYAVLVKEDGTTLASREVFTGYGDVLKSKMHGDVASFTLTLRGLLADWSAAPRAYYSPSDQKRIHAGDEGFAYINQLQDSTVSGWSNAPEVSGGLVNMRRSANFSLLTQCFVLYDSLTGELYGNELYGLSMFVPFSGTPYLQRHAASATYYKEDVTAALTQLGLFSGNWVLQVGSANCVINVSNEVQTAGGNVVQGDDSASEDMRRPGAIAGLGTATADTVAFPDVGFTGVSRIGWNSASSGSKSWTSADWSGAVFNAADGAFIQGDSATSYQAWSRLQEPSTGYYNYYYVEDVTGTAAIVSSSGEGNLQVGGANCTISTTGVVLSPDGRKIIRSGADPATNYLRVWT